MSICIGVSSLTCAPSLFFFLFPLRFEFSLEYQYIPWYCVEHFYIRFIYFGELPNMQHLYRENLILISLLISLFLFFLFAWYFYFAAKRNSGFGDVFSEIEVLWGVLKQHPSITLPNYYPQINSNLLKHSAVSVSKPWKNLQMLLELQPFFFCL